MIRTGECLRCDGSGLDPIHEGHDCRRCYGSGDERDADHSDEDYVDDEGFAH